MTKKYRFVRMPSDVFDIYWNIKCNMEKDITNVTGKQTKLTLPKVFKVVASPEYNRNFIEVDMHKLVSLARRKR